MRGAGLGGRWLMAGVLVAWLCVHAVPAPAASLTLATVLEMAMNHDPGIRDARARIDIGRLKKKQAQRKFWPKVDIQTVYGPQLDYFGQPITDQNTYFTSVGLEQPLYTGGTLKNSVKQAVSETRRFEWEYRMRELALAAEAVKAYYQALTAQAAIGQYEALTQAGQEDLEEGRERLRVGEATQAEVLELEVKVLETRQKLSKAQADYQVALSGLRKLTGLEETEGIRLLEHYPLKDIPAELPQLLAEAQNQRPLLAYLQEETNYQQFRVKAEKGKRLPQLSLVARYGWQAPQIMGERKDWLVLLKGSISLGNSTLSYGEQRTETFPNIYAFPTQGLTGPRTFAFSVRSLRYTLFDGSTNQVQLAEAQADKTLAEGRLKESQRQTHYDVKDAWAKKTDSEARLATAQKQITLAEELLTINRTKYGLGLATTVEVFKARAALAEAQVNLATAKNDRAIALGQLYQAVGRNLGPRP